MFTVRQHLKNREEVTLMTDIPEKCRAAVLVEYGEPLEIRELSVPDVEPGGILVKTEMASICGTDVHQWRGEGRPAHLPLVPGHESVDRVVKLGKGGKNDCAGEPLQVGDRIMWSHVSCGNCYPCEVLQQRNLCENRFSYGYNYSLTGSFAEYEYVVPGSEVVKVPEELSNEEVIGACCAFRTAVAAFERLKGAQIQSSVVVQGAGPVGLYCTLLADLSGARQIIVIGAPEKRLGLARKWGADHVIDIGKQPDPIRRQSEIMDLTSGKGPDVVVEASGFPEAFAEGLDIVRRGGTYLVIGQTSPRKITMAPGTVVWKHLQILGQCGAEIRHYYRALQIIKNNRGRYPFAEIITNKFSLDRINEAYASMEAGKDIKPAIVF
jgi:L-iditol 2-dehydrogenase